MLDAAADDAAEINVGDEITLERNGEIYATMKIEEKFEMSEDEKKWECEKVYKGHGEESADDCFWKIAMEDHPGVQMVMARKEFCLAGPCKSSLRRRIPRKIQRRLPDPQRNPRNHGRKRLGQRCFHAAEKPHAQIP